MESTESSQSRENSLKKQDNGKKVNFISESECDSSEIKSVKKDSLRRESLTVKEDHRSPRKFITTWRLACDKTKDRTKELLKRWRTLPEVEADNDEIPSNNLGSDRCWSVHVWATWVKRYPSDEENLLPVPHTVTNTLSATQKEKFGHFFSHLLDTDCDNLISLQDFDAFTERLRHFTDWSSNSGEYLILLQVQQGFVEDFLLKDQLENSEVTEPTAWIDMEKGTLSLEDWLLGWHLIVAKARSLQDFPVWLQYLPKVIFTAINKSGSGIISRDELSAFYSSVLGLTAQRVGEILDEAYNAMTANGDHALSYEVYRLCFCNFLLGRHPNGPGQYLFGCVGKRLSTFPVDYSALNTAPEDLEQYTPDKKSNRHSVVI